MNDEQLRALRDVLGSRTAAALGTLHEGAPWVSMAPFAALPDGSGLVIHVSRLAAHTKDMLADGRVSVLVMQPDAPGTFAQALPRVTIQGTAVPVERGSAEWIECETAYLSRFPDAAPMTTFGDFLYFVIRPVSARWVGGFAQAQTIAPSRLAEALRPA